jgi:hypothetical protein
MNKVKNTHIGIENIKLLPSVVPIRELLGEMLKYVKAKV